MNVPNIISIFRLTLVPFIVITFFVDSIPNNMTWALVLIFISGVSDYIDGFIARKCNLVSELGKILDPLADKLTQVVIFICLYFSGIIPWWLALVFIAKECLMIAGGIKFYNNKINMMSANIAGKATTISFYIMLGLVLILPDMDSKIKVALMCIPVALALISFTMYLHRYIIMKRNREI